MINRKTLLVAAAAIVLPAAIAGAQTPLTATGSNPTPSRRTTPPTPPAEEPVAPTANTATEDAQEATTPPATTPEPVNENAEPGTQTDATAQTTAPAPTPAEPQQQPTPAPAPAETQTQAQAQPQPAPAPAPAQAPASTQAQAQAQTQTEAGATTLATAADVVAGVQVRDQTGGMVGTIESVDATGAVVAPGTARAKLPLTSFGRNNQGLVISLTRAQLEAAAQQSQPTPTAS
jgi:hypothetical protein